MSDRKHPAEHTVAEHEHSATCGHPAVKHEDHVDYVHDGHRHAPPDGHSDEPGPTHRHR